LNTLYKVAAFYSLPVSMLMREKLDVTILKL